MNCILKKAFFVITWMHCISSLQFCNPRGIFYLVNSVKFKTEFTKRMAAKSFIVW